MEHQVTHDESEPQQEEAQHSCAETEPTPLSNQHSLALGRSRRANFGKPPTKYGFEDMMAYATSETNGGQKNHHLQMGF